MAVSPPLRRRGRRVCVTADGGAVGTHASGDAARCTGTSVRPHAVHPRVGSHHPDCLDKKGLRAGSIPPPPPARGPMAASQALACGGLSRRAGSAVPLRGSHDSPTGACGCAAIGAGDGALGRFPT